MRDRLLDQSPVGPEPPGHESSDPRQRIASALTHRRTRPCSSRKGESSTNRQPYCVDARAAHRIPSRRSRSRAAVLARSPRGRPHATARCGRIGVGGRHRQPTPGSPRSWTRSRRYRFPSVLHGRGPAQNARARPRTRRLDHPPRRSVGRMPGLRGQPVRAGRRVRNRGIAQENRCSRKARARRSGVRPGGPRLRLHMGVARSRLSSTHRGTGSFPYGGSLGVVVNWLSVGLTDDFCAPCWSVRRIPTHGRLTPCGN